MTFAKKIILRIKNLMSRMDITSKEGFYRPDGVHLNVLGLEFYFDALKENKVY